MICQMLCGRCKRDASYILHAGGSKVPSLDVGTGVVHMVVATKRDIVACGGHKTNLEKCSTMYGGRVERMR